MTKNEEKGYRVSAKREAFEKSFGGRAHDGRATIQKSVSVRSFTPSERFHSPVAPSRKSFSPKSAGSGLRRRSIGESWPPRKPIDDEHKCETSHGGVSASSSLTRSTQQGSYSSPVSVKHKAKIFGQVKVPDLEMEGSPVKKRNGVDSKKSKVGAGAWPPSRGCTPDEGKSDNGGSNVDRMEIQTNKQGSSAGKYRLDAFVSPVPRKIKAKGWAPLKTSPQSISAIEAGDASGPKKIWGSRTSDIDQEALPVSVRTPQPGRRSIESKFKYGDLPRLDANESLSPSRVKGSHQWIPSRWDDNIHRSKGSVSNVPQIRTSVGSMAAHWNQVANPNTNFSKDRSKELSPQVPVSTRRTAFESKAVDTEAEDDIIAQKRWTNANNTSNPPLPEGDDEYTDLVDYTSETGSNENMKVSGQEDSEDAIIAIGGVDLESVDHGESVSGGSDRYEKQEERTHEAEQVQDITSTHNGHGRELHNSASDTLFPSDEDNFLDQGTGVKTDVDGHVTKIAATCLNLLVVSRKPKRGS